MRLEPIKERWEGAFALEPSLQEDLEVQDFNIISRWGCIYSHWDTGNDWKTFIVEPVPSVPVVGVTACGAAWSKAFC